MRGIRLLRWHCNCTMLENNLHNAVATMPQRIEINQRISEILNRVDRLVKDGKLEEADGEIAKAKEIDPRFMYTHAYEERVTLLKEQEKRNRESAEVKQIAEEADRRKRGAETRRKREAEIISAREQQSKNTPPKVSQRPQRSKEEHAKDLEAYSRVLFEVWIDGAATPEEEKRLSDLRISFSIEVEEHFVMEAAVKRECYVAAFRNLWASGALTPEGASTLSSLRKKFNISAAEFEPIELELLGELRPKRKEGIILLIDDDSSVLQVVEGILLDHGFEVRAFPTSDDAYKYLRSNTPDLIISDINLETSTMGGLAFLERVREIDRLLDIPFIFLSGLTDEVVVRTGKALGADDYVTKPFDPETLLAIIRGKLKRFKQLRNITLN